MTDAKMKYIIARIISNARDALDDYERNKDDDFFKGKRFAYYEALDTIKNELIVEGQDLKEYGLDLDLDKTFM